MLRYDIERERARRGRIQPQQLQLQAFGRGPRADARRIEAVHERERRVQFVDVDFELRRQIGEHFVERRAQVAVVVERFDQERDERAIARARLRDAQLRHQMIAQRRRGFVDLHRRQIVVVGCGGGAAEVVEIPLARVAAVGRIAVVFVDAGGFVALGALIRRSRAVRRAGHRLGRGRRGRLRDHRAVGRDAQGARDPVVVVLEQRVLRDRRCDFLLQFERRQLQQPDRLLKLGREREMLRQAKLETGFHGKREVIPEVCHEGGALRHSG